MPRLWFTRVTVFAALATMIWALGRHSAAADWPMLGLTARATP